MEQATVDRVVVINETGRRSYSVQEFLALPLATRIQHILARDVEFYQGVMRVERAEALKSLRR